MNNQELDFGRYVRIEQKRYGAPNEMYLYKVINRMESNSFVTVPVREGSGEKTHAGLVPVVSCIRCGVNETEVLKFRIEDVHIVDPDTPPVPTIKPGDKVYHARFKAQGKVKKLSASGKRAYVIWPDCAPSYVEIKNLEVVE